MMTVLMSVPDCVVCLGKVGGGVEGVGCVGEGNHSSNNMLECDSLHGFYENSYSTVNTRGQRSNLLVNGQNTPLVIIHPARCALH